MSNFFGSRQQASPQQGAQAQASPQAASPKTRRSPSARG